MSSSFSNGEPTQGAVVRLLNADGTPGQELGRTDAEGRLSLDLSSVGNGTCDDDITHWSNMINKRTDAPLYEKSKTIAEVAQKAGSVWQCENFMHEAIRMIKKPYPTE